MRKTMRVVEADERCGRDKDSAERLPLNRDAPSRMSITQVKHDRANELPGTSFPAIRLLSFDPAVR